MNYVSLLCLAMLGASVPEAGQRVARSVHEQELIKYESTPSVLGRRVYRSKSGEVEGSALDRFSRLVYGYYPYWADSDDDIPWEALTHLAYFNVEVRADGSLGDSHGWAERGAALVEAGHDWGVAVTLTATLFDEQDIRTLLADTQSRSAAVDNLYALVTSVGGHGVNIDFEFVPSADGTDGDSPRENFVSFIAELSERFHAHEPSLHVSLATPAIDWGGTYDYSELARLSDGLMIMGYGYHWSGGSPGPVAPLRSSEFWGTYSLEWTVLDYLTWGGEENRDKLVLGIPLYGRDWPTTDTNLPGTSTATGVAKSLAQCDTLFETDKLWDVSSNTPYRVYWADGQAHQLFCEDLESIRTKLELIDEYELGGLMLWDVGKVSSTHGVWSEIVSAYDVGGTTVDDSTSNQPPVAVVSADERSVVGSTVVLDARGSFDPDGDALSFSWVQRAGPEVELDVSLDVMALAHPSVTGAYVFELTLSDGVLYDVEQIEIEVYEHVDGGSAAAGHDDVSMSDDEGGCQAIPAQALWLLWLGGALYLRRMRRG